MVANFDGTVGNFEKTVAFIKATNYLKEEHGVKFVEIGKLLGLNKGQMNMLRIKRRHVSKKEIDTLLQAYPGVSSFFKKTESDTSLFEQTLNEPMSTHFYGKQPNHLEELVVTQKKLIERLENELSVIKETLKTVEIENKALKEVISQIK